MAILKTGDWVMTKMKKIGWVNFEEGEQYVHLAFPDSHWRSYRRDSLVLLDESMQKLLNATYEEFVRVNTI